MTVPGHYTFIGELRVLDKHQYAHVFALGLIFAAFDAYGIGSNDVANSFATSIGSKSLTLRSACCIAICSEFIGAMALGSDVADTIKGKILSAKAFKGQSDVLMLGMLCASIGSSIFVNLASYWGMPVSTTHAIVGATIGVGIAFGGPNAILWGECQSGTYNCPGVVGIVISWFFSPALAAALAMAIYIPTKFLILYPGGETSFWRAKMTYPFYLWVTWSIIAFFMILTGGPKINAKYQIYEKNLSGEKIILHNVVGPVVGVSLGIGAFFALLGAIFIHSKWMYDYCHFVPDENAEKKENAEEEEVPTGFTFAYVKYRILKNFSHDVTTIKDSNVGADFARSAHDRAVEYYEPTEKIYSAIQVFTASFASLAHGANDVSNAVAPLCTVFFTYRTGYTSISKTVPVETWILALGGGMIDIGLAISGWRLMENLGNNITYHSPSRGFAMELGALSSVLYASQQGKPVSTTHCITGATVGVGICNGDARSINWVMICWAFFGWFITLPLAGVMAGLVFAFVAKSPHILSAPDQQKIYRFNSTGPLKALYANSSDPVYKACYQMSSCNKFVAISTYDQPLHRHT